MWAPKITPAVPASAPELTPVQQSKLIPKKPQVRLKVFRLNLTDFAPFKSQTSPFTQTPSVEQLGSQVKHLETMAFRILARLLSAKSQICEVESLLQMLNSNITSINVNIASKNSSGSFMRATAPAMPQQSNPNMYRTRKAYVSLLTSSSLCSTYPQGLNPRLTITRAFAMSATTPPFPASTTRLSPIQPHFFQHLLRCAHTPLTPFQLVYGLYDSQ